MKNIFLILFVGIIFTSCEEVVKLDLNTAPARLTIDARLTKSTNQPIQVIKLSLTRGFYNAQISPISNASVQLLDLTNSITHNFEHDNINPGDFVLDYTPNLDTDYKLLITYNNDIYESSVERLMPAVPIDQLTQGSGTLFQGDEKEVLVTITDDGSQDNYYIFDFGYNLFLATKDEFYQGNTFTFSYFYEDLEAGDMAEISVYGADESYFNFMTAIIEQTEESGDPFQTTPSTVRGNLFNTSNPSQYPMGYFSIGETYSASILLE